ncbi:mitochondrial acidic protein mam33-like isoform X1 [Magnolia sinica]|uniref:mitochondrial acidic protein mam33-like isoform X1 n=1 Tax=Magnolia sinica TaxID=86752 RepID=UPI002657D533|nr:mitochondrial acidic protein mam33-like isoform X1 [Magnolia sinica]XP_058107795.1 mitochondrial acidic protein mam33-like isoform X1 [Magnolia sinica]
MAQSRRLLKLLFSLRRYGTVRDRDLINALQSELKYEQSSNPYQKHLGGSLGDFVLDWDAPQSQDVVLRRKYGMGEEIAVSALLGPEAFEEEEGALPRKAFMKVCMRKPGLSSVLQFDCGLFSRGADGSDFDIRNAYYLQSVGLGALDYKGPSFRSLDPELQKAFKEYLVARGITEELTNFLLLHLHKKELLQYVSWLHRLKTMVVTDA